MTSNLTKIQYNYNTKKKILKSILALVFDTRYIENRKKKKLKIIQTKLNLTQIENKISLITMSNKKCVIHNHSVDFKDPASIHMSGHVCIQSICL